MDRTLAKEQRIENILLTLKRFDYLTQSQLQIIHNLKGDRNANRILNGMSEYLHHFRHGLEKVYYLSKAGRDRVDAEVVRKKTPNIQHFLLRNQLWIHLKYPHTWQNEVKISVKDVSLVADATYTMRDKNLAIVEVDISQPMIKNKAKIEKYRKVKEMTGNEFSLLWVTELDSRKAKLTELMKDMPGHVFTLKEIR